MHVKFAPQVKAFILQPWIIGLNHLVRNLIASLDNNIPLDQGIKGISTVSMSLQRGKIPYASIYMIKSLLFTMFSYLNLHSPSTITDWLVQGVGFGPQSAHMGHLFCSFWLTGLK